MQAYTFLDNKQKMLRCLQISKEFTEKTELPYSHAASLQALASEDLGLPLSTRSEYAQQAAAVYAKHGSYIEAQACSSLHKELSKQTKA